MQFDWNLLRPERELSEAERSLVQDIGVIYLNTGMGTPDHKKKAELGKDRALLNGLVQLGLIRSNWNKYYPTFLSLYFLPSPLRERYAKFLQLTLTVIKALYVDSGPQPFSIEQVEQRMRDLLFKTDLKEFVYDLRESQRQLKLLESAWDLPYESTKFVPILTTELVFKRATLFLQDFTHFVFVRESSDHDTPVGTVIATDNIFDYENLQQAWEQEIARRGAGHIRYTDSLIAKEEESVKMASKPDTLGDKSRNVFVVHGRDERLRIAIFTFLRALGLEPLEWTVAMQLAGKGAPYIGEILEAAFEHAQGVVVLLSPDDEARLRKDLVHASDHPSETILEGQPRPNVLFEAGMAFASHPNQTVLVQFGHVKPFSDVAGRHILRLDNSVQKRQEFAVKLKTAGCSVRMEGADWHTTGDFTPPIVNTGRPPSPAGRDSPPNATLPHMESATSPDQVSNLVSLKPLAKPRRVLPDDSDTWRDVGQQQEGLLAAIAIFRNEPVKGVSFRRIDGLTAQIAFFEANGGEVQRVNYGTWLGDPFNNTLLAVGDTRELLIAVDHPGGPSPVAIENTRSRASDYSAEGTREKPLTKSVYDVTVRLIGRAATPGDVVDSFHFSLDLRGEVPIIKREWSRQVIQPEL